MNKKYLFCIDAGRGSAAHGVEVVRTGVAQWVRACYSSELWKIPIDPAGSAFPLRVKNTHKERNEVYTMGNNIVDAAKTGDRLKTLIALRDLLAERLNDSNSNRDVASMSKRMMQCLAEIEEIKKTEIGAELCSLDVLRGKLKIG